MHDTPGTIPPAAPTKLHSRRPPAHRSVSLRHSPPAAHRRGERAEHKTAVHEQLTSLSSPNPASDKANPPSVSPKLLSNKNSSGESSDAGKWFETTNNNAHQNGVSFLENDPPFFLRNSSSSETPPDSYDMQNRLRSTMPYRPNILNAGTDGSSTEDFRSVIDDLTVANKKLRQRLKKYEKQYDAHLEEEKLFEVRFHGLPDHKKKELEETLRKFASSLDDTTTGKLASYAPALEQQPTASSTSRFAESGYVSMSASGQNSSAPSNQASNHTEKHHRMSKSAYNRQQQSIQSYLHDIPVGLLTENKAPMTEKMKKKLVVRRLEQIFAGKRSAPGAHSQPMQQEEVAQSAATADRQEREATGQQHKPEGLRIAKIMPELPEKKTSGQPAVLQKLRPTLRIEEQDFAGASSPDQRPTRPLDLDLYRAQVPVENMDYIRHLGFTPPDMDTGAAPMEDHGWLYLNLLINMAQLHTLNVTTDYVKDALHEYSSHLELSRDGRKVRWKGGLEVTTHTSDTSSEQHNGLSPYDNGSSPSKRLKTEHSSSTEDAQFDPDARARRIARAQREKEKKQFAYTPMFFHKEESEDEDDFYGFDIESSGNSLQRPQPAGDSSGFGSSAMQSRSSARKPKREDGPMIFYTKAKFCTDLSGDRLGNALGMNAYKAVTSHPLGATYPSALSSSTSIVESRGPLAGLSMEVDSNNGSKTASSADSLGFSPHALELSDGNDSPAFIGLEASGIGGVHPEDNFSIHVRRSHTQFVPSGPSGRRRSSLYPSKIQNALKDAAPHGACSVSPSNPQAVIKEEILSASRRTLPNSALPPASFLPLNSTSSADVDSDLDSMSSEEENSDSGEGPATALQLLNISPHTGGRIFDESEQDSDEESGYSEDSDDGSVDLLATARQLDPNTIRSQEREYDAAIADRLAEEIVAGSSAATAGGGSGFNTPAHGIKNLNREASVPKRGDQSITSGSLSSRSKLKRTRTSDSAQYKDNRKKTKSLKKEA